MTEHKFVPSKNANPSKMSFSFFQWVWAFFALIRFWDKRFRPTNMGSDTVRVYRHGAPLKTWQVMILMRIRGERPMTIEEATAAMSKGDLDGALAPPIALPGTLFNTPPHVPTLSFQDGSLTSRGLNWNDGKWQPEHRFLSIRKD